METIAPIFFGSLALAIVAFELTSGLQRVLAGGRRNALAGAQTGRTVQPPPRPSVWAAIFVNIFPTRFDPDRALDSANVISMLRRAGYPYSTPGEYYAAAVRYFSTYLLVGAMFAGALVMLDMAFVAPAVAAVFVALGLRKPYARLKTLARKRAEGMRNNMLIGLSVLTSLLSAGIGVQEALRRTAAVGGPFCNLLGLLVSQMETRDFSEAIASTRAHLPDAKDVEANLFLRDVEDFFVTNRPILPSVQALQQAVHRQVVESTEARAALVRQRAGLSGVVAVVGLLIGIIWPFLSMGGF